ncbi:hypothetical protein BJ741DRAFT_146638 [Chytriomyces cf. hyalinus JEL632]|nr:hypothetical protein BJ741DRAFT_146638 [Chytriomyces cf. hyalinus JEL632]
MSRELFLTALVFLDKVRLSPCSGAVLRNLCPDCGVHSSVISSLLAIDRVIVEGSTPLENYWVGSMAFVSPTARDALKIR